MRPDQSIGGLLHRLNTAEAGAAWASFVDLYSPLIMKAVHQFEFEQDRAGECYLYICEKLCDNGFQRLLKFNTGGRAQFSTWLSTVVYHLCVDWHRREYGRAQLLPAITALPAFDQSVFRLHFEQSMDREACLQTLRDEFPDLTRQQLSDAVARVHRVLTPRQRWQLSVRQRRRQGGDHRVEGLVDTGPAPEEAAHTTQEQARLRRAMETLDSDQRLILQLRFQQGLTLKKIGEVMHLGDAFRANRRLKAAQKALAGALHHAERRKN